jgi:hypothetical protein
MNFQIGEKIAKAKNIVGLHFRMSELEKALKVLPESLRHLNEGATVHVYLEGADVDVSRQTAEKVLQLLRQDLVDRINALQAELEAM